MAVLAPPSCSRHTGGQGHPVSPAAYAVIALQRKDSAVPGQREEYDWLTLELCVSLACLQACTEEVLLEGSTRSSSSTLHQRDSQLSGL